MATKKMRMMIKDNRILFLYVLAIIKFVLPFLLQNSYYQPHRDEFLYLAEGNHLAWGFLEVPPLLSVFAWMVHALGDTMFWIKFFPSLLGACTYLLVGYIIISLGGKYFSLVLAFFAFVFGGYLRVHFLFQPNFLEIFFYTAIAYALVKYIQTEKNSYLYLFGVSCGLGMMSKYSVAFFIVSILLALVLTKQRKIFNNKHLYIAMIVGFIIFLPNIIWQYSHNFPVVHHMQELKEEQLQYISASTFLFDQLVMNLPCFFVWMAGLLFIIFSKQGRTYIPFFFAYFFTIILLIALHGKGYYALGLYPVLFAFGSYQLEKITSTKAKWLRVIFIIVPIYLGLTFIPISLPIFAPNKLAAFYQQKHLDKYGLLRWEDQQNHPLPQDFADMLGWKEVTEQTANVYNSLSEEDKKKTIIKCDKYCLSGALNFYGKNYNLPEAYSYNASFLLWFPDTLHTIANVITVGENFPDSTKEIVKYFESISVKGELKEPLARENGAQIILWYHCKDDLLSKFLENEAVEKKRRFLR